MGGIANAENLKSQWQKIRNLQTAANVLVFLTDNNINSMDEFCNKVAQMHEQLKSVTDEVRKAERRLGTLSEHLAHVENMNNHKSIYKKYKSLAPKKSEAMNSINPFTRKKAVLEYETSTRKQEAYYDKHGEEIQAYQNAKKYFDSVMNGRNTLPVKEWQSEQKKLLAKRYNLCDKYYSLKDEIKNVEVIRRSVEKIINEDVHNRQLVQMYDRDL